MHLLVTRRCWWSRSLITITCCRSHDHQITLLGDRGKPYPRPYCHMFEFANYVWGLLMWEIGRRLGHYGDHPRPQVADKGTPSRVDKRVALDREGVADKQCQGEGKLWSQCDHKPRGRLFPKTGPALQQKTEEREREYGIHRYVKAVKVTSAIPH